jgi:prepilin-type N-terminal cleavage/methylation domain-containing protein
MSFKIFKNKGFTLIELLVVILIIGLISTILVADWRKNERQYRLQRTAQTIVQDIRKVQDMALASMEFQGSIPQGRYAVRFREQDPDSYLLFADVDDNGAYSGEAEKIDAPTFENEIELDSICTYTTAPTQGINCRTTIHTWFTPPDPLTEFDPGGANVGGVNINIKRTGADCLSSPQDCRAITVTRQGMIGIAVGALK